MCANSFCDPSYPPENPGWAESPPAKILPECPDPATVDTSRYQSDQRVTVTFENNLPYAVSPLLSHSLFVESNHILFRSHSITSAMMAKNKRREHALLGLPHHSRLTSLMLGECALLWEVPFLLKSNSPGELIPRLCDAYAHL